jgi:hypothetical protein
MWVAKPATGGDVLVKRVYGHVGNVRQRPEVMSIALNARLNPQY